MSAPRRPRRGVRFASAFGFAVGVMATAAGCGEELDVRPEAELAPVEGPLQRVAQIHAVIRPFGDGSVPAMAVTARFVEYRGVDEPFARQRSNMIALPWDTLAPGSCKRVETEPATLDGEVGEFYREVSLVDGGDLRLELGGRDIPVPLALVPDLLPYVAGVEYLYQNEHVPPLEAYPDGSVPFTVRMDGSGVEEVPPFEVGTRVPRRVRLTGATLDATTLDLRWRPAGTSEEELALTLHGSNGEVTCLMPDSGRAQIDRATLRALDFDVDGATSIDVSASRLNQLSVDAGEFTGIELIVESRDRRSLPL